MRTIHFRRFFFFFFHSSFLSGRAECVSWVCQRIVSEGKRNPVCKSHHRDFAVARGLCLLCFTAAVLSCWQDKAVVCFTYNAVKKRTARMKPASCAPGATRTTKEEMHFTSHVWHLSHALIDNTSSQWPMRKHRVSVFAVTGCKPGQDTGSHNQASCTEHFMKWKHLHMTWQDVSALRDMHMWFYTVSSYACAFDCVVR